jgi:hypothetical protein
VANADSSLTSAIQNCQAGNQAAADKIYQQYITIAAFATSTVSSLCGGAPGATLPGGTAGSANFNLWISASGNITLNVICNTNSTAPSSITNPYHLAASGLTQSQCTAQKAALGF